MFSLEGMDSLRLFDGVGGGAPCVMVCCCCANGFIKTPLSVITSLRSKSMRLTRCLSSGGGQPVASRCHAAPLPLQSPDAQGPPPAPPHPPRRLPARAAQPALSGPYPRGPRRLHRGRHGSGGRGGVS